MHSLTVVIPTYNRAISLNNCLQSLTKQTDKDFTVLIIDGGSTDQTSQIITRYQQKLHLRVIVDKTPHLSYIRNLGWQNATSKLVAYIDDDVVVCPDWVASIKHTLGDKMIGGVTGPTIVPTELLTNRDIFLLYTPTNSFLKILSIIYFRLFMQGEKYGIGRIYPCGAWSPGSNFSPALSLKKPLEVEYLEACNFAIPKKIISQAGGYDLGYKYTSEWCEVDLSFRIRRRGYKLIFNPQMAVEHQVSSSGVYIRRFASFHRLLNFFRFYLKTYYPQQGYRYPSTVFLFPLYSLAQIMYYCYISLWRRSSYNILS